MSKQGRILVVDDIEEWREELTEILEHGGFYVESAPTARQALDQLDKMLYHLLILDIRMDHLDPGNADGIDMLKVLDERGLNEATKVIMLSAYDTKERIRTAFKDFKVVDFLSKDSFDKHSFLASVKQVFTQEIQINLQLAIHWQQATGPEQAVLNTEIEGIRIKQNTSLQNQIALELDDLLRRLFYQAESILARPLTSGQSGTGVLWVQPFYNTGGGRAVVIKFGSFRRIDEEYHNFKLYVQPFIGGGRSTTVLNLCRTPHLGGIMYSLLGATNDSMEDFGNFYHHADLDRVKDVLDELFLDTCSAWYANPGKLQPSNLTEDYQQSLNFTAEKLEKAIAELQKSVQGKQVLRFKYLKKERAFTNPLLFLSGPPLIRPTYICITHGDFNQHNLLIDSTNHTWLIDFQSTGKGHILRDVAQLDSEIRFFILRLQDATLEERLIMEETLCGANRLEQLPATLATENQFLAKAYATVIHLRGLARKLVAQNPNDNTDEYSIALLYNALNTLRFYTLSSRQREHALLCASLLVDKLGLRG